ncbi:MAG: iron-sulfur cluster assembly accessory protein [Alphaproteobacteria bacterium]|nr:iron-sulfur cluster assembly accessory protein [Alphaproteobacteria bacterium]
MDIKITAQAASHIQNLMKKAPEGSPGLRLTVGATGCSGNSYKMEYVKPGSPETTDDIIESGGVRINIPKMFSWMLIGMTIDYITDALGNSRFEFINPNETGRCGCGESFQVAPAAGNPDTSG